MEVIPLFPQLVCQEVLDRPISEEELTFITGQATRESEGHLISVDSYILDNPQLEALKGWLLMCVKQYLFEVNKVDANLVDVFITQSWTNYEAPGGTHHQHVHTNSIVSGVFYIHGEGESDKITFFKDFTGSRTLDLPMVEWWDGNAKSWWLPANTGTLYIFPSTLTHGVEATTSKTTRISLAFNTFVRGTLGEKRKLTELIL